MTEQPEAKFPDILSDGYRPSKQPDAVVKALDKLITAIEKAKEVGCVQYLDACEDGGEFFYNAIETAKQALSAKQPASKCLVGDSITPENPHPETPPMGNYMWRTSEEGAFTRKDGLHATNTVEAIAGHLFNTSEYVTLNDGLKRNLETGYYEKPPAYTREELVIMLFNKTYQKSESGWDEVEADKYVHRLRLILNTLISAGVLRVKDNEVK
jgi:hypothetical protein